MPKGKSKSRVKRGTRRLGRSENVQKSTSRSTGGLGGGSEPSAHDLADSMTPPLEDQFASTPASIGSAPVELEPDQSVHLQSLAEQPTIVHIENASSYIGEVLLRWGSHSEEVDHCDPGATDLSRNFDGLAVLITNTGNVPLRISMA